MSCIFPYRQREKLMMRTTVNIFACPPERLLTCSVGFFHNTHINPVSAAERLVINLHFITGNAMSTSLKVGSAMIGYRVGKVCITIWTVLKYKFVAFQNVDQWKCIQKDLWNYPNCVGAIDGILVWIRAPADSKGVWT